MKCPSCGRKGTYAEWDRLEAFSLDWVSSMHLKRTLPHKVINMPHIELLVCPRCGTVTCFPKEELYEQ